MKQLLVLLLMTLGFNLKGQTFSDQAAITQTVQLYFDGMIERDRAKLDIAFIPEARLIGYRGNKFTITSYEDWAAGTSEGEARNSNLYKNELVSIRIEGNTAVAETQLFWPEITYYDFLTLIKIEGSWKIVNKSWSETKN